MKKYNPQKIEKKWQKKWTKEKLYEHKDDPEKKKYYVLDMFPYPSGDGLHMGHTESYTASDIIYRFKKMRGYAVLHPQGFDSFGLPAENYAIKTGVHPMETTRKNTDNYLQQMKMLGLGHDFKHLIYTSDPSYYKWTQYFFGKFFENGLVERKTDKINWCPSCRTGIANEQVVNGKCERCKAEIEQREVPGWFFKITDFADDLIKDLDEVDWPEHTKKNQKAWIGKSKGAKLNFKLKILNFNSSSKNRILNKALKVFTTRPDTLFGATYMVLAPEHQLVENLKEEIENHDEVLKYVEQAQNKTEMERVENRGKTGVELKGIKAINPANNEEIPIFVADYVLRGYGTGAIMAVPAHDERDFEFAKKYNLPIRQVIASHNDNLKVSKKVLLTLKEIKKQTDKIKTKFWLLGGLACAFYVEKVYRDHDDLDLIVRDEDNRKKLIQVLKQMGFEKKKEKKISENLTNEVYKNKEGISVDIGRYMKEFGMCNDDFENDEKQLDGVSSLVISKRFVKNFKKLQLENRNEKKDILDWKYLNEELFTDDGIMINSGKFDEMESEKAKKAIVEFVGGEMTSNYRLRDWSISRQRYWGCPIPIVYSPKGEAKFVGEENLPWLLPEDVDFVPTGTAPLAKSKELKERVEKLFGKGWKPEVDTMDTFVDSSWYFLRYPDTESEKEFCSKEKLKRWLPVDLYIGGAEHTYLHLLYARFFVKALRKIGLINFSEPFLKLRHQGMVLDKNGVKMSKSKGNVVNPDEMVKMFGADATRMYMMFAGPLEDDVMWNEEGVKGVYRFLEKVWRIFQDKKMIDCGGGCEDVPKDLPLILHKTIKGVTDDIEKLKFNTAISKLMIFINECSQYDTLPKAAMEKFLILLAPFAPHIVEDIWLNFGHKESIFLEKWPEYNSNLIREETIEMVVQINGKVRDRIEVGSDISKDKAGKKALASEKVKKYIDGKEIKKIVFVPGKLVNIVIS